MVIWPHDIPIYGVMTWVPTPPGATCSCLTLPYIPVLDRIVSDGFHTGVRWVSDGCQMGLTLPYIPVLDRIKQEGQRGSSKGHFPAHRGGALLGSYHIW